MTDQALQQIGAGAGAEELILRRHVPLYSEFYGLLRAPFALTPDRQFLFLSARQREALSNLRHALSTSVGFTLLIGEAGTGKTTLIQAALADTVGATSRFVLVNNPTLSRSEFYEFLANQFGLSAAAATSKPQFLTELRNDIEARFAAGGVTVLIVDEAQSMPHELLEEVRLLGNVETSTAKLLNVVLSGQPELAQRLNESSLRQLKQRVALRCELAPLSLSETASYIAGRLRIAGGAPADILTRDAVVTVYEAARGVPRTINVVCDNALMTGFAAQVKPVDVAIVEEVCRDFDLDASDPPPEPPSMPPGAPTESPLALDRSTPESGALRRRPRFSFFN